MLKAVAIAKRWRYLIPVGQRLEQTRENAMVVVIVVALKVLARKLGVALTRKVQAKRPVVEDETTVEGGLVALWIGRRRGVS